MSKVLPVVTFVVGAFAGALAANYILKDKYEKIVQEELESIHEAFSKDKKPAEKKNENDILEKKPEEGMSVSEYAKKLSEENYTNYSTYITTDNDLKEAAKVAEKMAVSNNAYVIPPEEFGELDNYAKISLTYYADKVLADENDEIVENVEQTVGVASLSRFGEYEDDSVFVRNDILKADYEILQDLREFADVIESRARDQEV